MRPGMEVIQFRFEVNVFLFTCGFYLYQPTARVYKHAQLSFVPLSKPTFTSVNKTKAITAVSHETIR